MLLRSVKASTREKRAAGGKLQLFYYPARIDHPRPQTFSLNRRSGLINVPSRIHSPEGVTVSWNFLASLALYYGIHSSTVRFILAGSLCQPPFLRNVLCLQGRMLEPGFQSAIERETN